MATEKKHYCASCRNGEIKREADCFVQGKVHTDKDEYMHPYKAYLCNDHIDMMLDDGAIFNVERKL